MRALPLRLRREVHKPECEVNKPECEVNKPECAVNKPEPRLCSGRPMRTPRLVMWRAHRSKGALWPRRASASLSVEASALKDISPKTEQHRNWNQLWPGG